MTVFGQLVIGPPGSGKTTYCMIMQDFLTKLGREVCVINLDPANENLTYKCDLNIYELITVEDVMINCNLGPNGGLLYAIEYLETNIKWLEEKLKDLCKSKTNPYLLFDFPGQIELFTNHNSVKAIIEHLANKMDYRLCTVNLVDSHYCTDPGKFISVLLTSLNSMLHIEMPHVNILSKIDLIEQYGKLKFNLDYYTDVLDLDYLADCLTDDKIYAKYKKLNKLICDVVQDFSLVHYLPLNIQDDQSLAAIVQQIDQANGYLYGHLDNEQLLSTFRKQTKGYFDQDEFVEEDEYIDND